MRWIPRNVPLAVTWRLLLLFAAAAVVLAIGIHQYEWQPIGPKKMINDSNDKINAIIQQEMKEEPAWQEPIENLIDTVKDAVEAALPAESEPEAEPPPVAEDSEQKPKPKAEDTPPAKPKAKAKEDDQALEDLLQDEVDQAKKKKKK
jgi:hypothetical protein